MELSACHHIYLIRSGGREGTRAHLIFVKLLAVDDLWPLNDILRGDERVVGDGLEGQAVMLPCRQVVGAVDGYATAFNLVFGLVFAKPPELALFINRDAAGVGVYQIPFGIVPSPARHDVLGLREAEKEEGEPHDRDDWVVL